MKTKMRRTNWKSANRVGFTLVELLVVITIIGILAALITAAGAGALKTARQNAIKTELDQITMALQSYKDTAGSYPPNCQTDDTNMTAEPPTSPNPIDETQVFNDLKRHMKQAFPKHRESENLLRVIAGLPATGSDAANYQKLLAGGMSSGEALVFWLGGFSSDPKYPISGEGGPSFRIDNLPTGVTADQADPIESRKWIFPFEVSRLQPRNADNYFESGDDRFIVYTVRINGVNQERRLNFWQYVPSKSEQPFLYFDVSRREPSAASDVPAAPSVNPNALHVHAIKQRSESAGAAVPIQFANKDKFQVLHCGVDGEWGEEVFEDQMSVHELDLDDVNDYLLYPDGPFTGDVADTLTNFSEGTLEASQP
jgi:prepilin-type N-terminal cleavage/methylation domain-containing protein